MKIELEDVGIVVVEQFLEVVDMFIAPGPDGLLYHVVYALHQYFFVM